MNKRQLMGWLTPEETAEILGYTLSSLKTMRSRGRGPTFYKAGQIRYKEADVQAYLLSRKGATK